MAPWRIGGQIFVASLFLAFCLMLPVTTVVLYAHMPKPPFGTATTIFPAAYMLSCIRLNLAWIVLTCGLSTAFGAFIAPPTKKRQYAAAPLPFCFALFCIVTIEAIFLPALFRASPSHLLMIGGSIFRLSDFLWAPLMAAIAAGIGWWAGIRLRIYPQSVIARVFNRCRTMQVGNNFGKPIRLHLDEVV